MQAKKPFFIMLSLFTIFICVTLTFQLKETIEIR